MPTAASTTRHTPLSAAQLEAVARRFRALGVASRLRVLDALMAGPLPMTDLADVTGLAQSNLSRQVTELELAGCVARERRGREVVVRIADPTLKQLCELVCGSLERRASETHASLRRQRATAGRR
jgi:ArsR family transcriptional regulator